MCDSSDGGGRGRVRGRRRNPQKPMRPARSEEYMLGDAEAESAVLATPLSGCDSVGRERRHVRPRWRATDLLGSEGEASKRSSLFALLEQMSRGELYPPSASDDFGNPLDWVVDAEQPGRLVMGDEEFGAVEWPEAEHVIFERPGDLLPEQSGVYGRTGRRSGEHDMDDGHGDDERSDEDDDNGEANTDLKNFRDIFLPPTMRHSVEARAPPTRSAADVWMMYGTRPESGFPVSPIIELQNEGDHQNDDKNVLRNRILELEGELSKLARQVSLQRAAASAREPLSSDLEEVKQLMEGGRLENKPGQNPSETRTRSKNIAERLRELAALADEWVGLQETAAVTAPSPSGGGTDAAAQEKVRTDRRAGNSAAIQARRRSSDDSLPELRELLWQWSCCRKAQASNSLRVHTPIPSHHRNVEPPQPRPPPLRSPAAAPQPAPPTSKTAAGQATHQEAASRPRPFVRPLDLSEITGAGRGPASARPADKLDPSAAMPRRPATARRFQPLRIPDRSASPAGRDAEKKKKTVRYYDFTARKFKRRIVDT